MPDYDRRNFLYIFDALLDVSAVAQVIAREQGHTDVYQIEARLTEEYQHTGVPFKVWIGVLSLDYCGRCDQEFQSGQYALYLPSLVDNEWQVRKGAVDGQAVHDARHHAISLPAACQDFLAQVPPICLWP